MYTTLACSGMLAKQLRERGRGVCVRRSQVSAREPAHGTDSF